MNATHLLEIIATRPLLNRKDLSRLLNCSLRTIDRLDATGTLPPAIHVRGKLWRPCDIERWQSQARTR